MRACLTLSKYVEAQICPGVYFAVAGGNTIEVIHKDNFISRNVPSTLLM